MVPSSTAAVHKATILQVFDNLGVPTAVGTDKVVGPSTCVTMLGIEIDSATGELCLPTDKLRALQHLLQSWFTHHVASRRELQSLVGQLQSLVGHLSFAAKVVPAGRTFTRRLIDACTSAHGSSPIVHLSSDALANIRWWQEFLPVWNGKALMRDPEWSRSPDLELFTDAYGLGFGGFFQGRWFAGAWSATQQTPPYTSIMWREMANLPRLPAVGTALDAEEDPAPLRQRFRVRCLGVGHLPAPRSHGAHTQHPPDGRSPQLLSAYPPHRRSGQRYRRCPIPRSVPTVPPLGARGRPQSVVTRKHPRRSVRKSPSRVRRYRDWTLCS